VRVLALPRSSFDGVISRLALYTPLDPSFVGGIRSWADSFLRPYCASRGIALRLVHTQTQPAAERGTSDGAKHGDIEERCLPGFPMPLYRGRVPSPASLRKELSDVDVVYFDNGYALQDVAMLAATRGRIPVIAGFHSVIKTRNVLHNAAWNLVGRNALRYFDAAHVLNGDDAAYLRQLGMRNVMTIPLAVDAARFAPAPLRNRFTITFVGRLHPQKGIDVLVRLLPLLHQHLPDDVAFAIAGDGPLRESLAPLQSLPRLSLLGSLTREKTAALLSQSAVVLMPSRYETFGYVAAEAISAGAVVVATDIAGPRDIVGDRGVLISPHEPLEAWLDAVTTVYRDWAADPSFFDRKRDERHASAQERFGFASVSAAFDELLAQVSRN